MQNMLHNSLITVFPVEEKPYLPLESDTLTNIIFLLSRQNNVKFLY